MGRGPTVESPPVPSPGGNPEPQCPPSLPSSTTGEGECAWATYPISELIPAAPPAFILGRMGEGVDYVLRDILRGRLAWALVSERARSCPRGGCGRRRMCLGAMKPGSNFHTKIGDCPNMMEHEWRLVSLGMWRSLKRARDALPPWEGSAGRAGEASAKQGSGCGDRGGARTACSSATGESWAWRRWPSPPLTPPHKGEGNATRGGGLPPPCPPLQAGRVRAAAGG
jgi:hypothetical protein